MGKSNTFMVNFIILNKLQTRYTSHQIHFHTHPHNEQQQPKNHTSTHLKDHAVIGKEEEKSDRITIIHTHTSHPYSHIYKISTVFSYVQSYSSYSRQNKPGKLKLTTANKNNTMPIALQFEMLFLAPDRTEVCLLPRRTHANFCFNFFFKQLKDGELKI